MSSPHDALAELLVIEENDSLSFRWLDCAQCDAETAHKLIPFTRAQCLRCYMICHYDHSHE